MGSGGCSSVIKSTCHYLTCGGGQYTVRFVHTIFCLGIPSTLIANERSDLHDWLVLHNGSYIFGFLYLGLLLASLIFYYSACLTDPGYVSQQTLLSLANEEDEDELFIQRVNNGHGYSSLQTSDTSLSTNQGAANNHLANENASNSAAVIDTGDITRNYDGKTTQSNGITDSLINRSPNENAAGQTRSENSQQDGDDTRICRICNIQQPLRSRHCTDCKRCVLKYDHHCPWLSTCVGENNHKYFWLFLLFINIVIVFSMWVAVRSFPNFNSKEHVELSGKDIGFTLLNILNMLILVVGGLSTVSLFGFHSYLMLTNQTTWESVSRRRISYLKRLRDDYNPFHLGYCANIYSFCCRCSPKHWKSVYRRSTSSSNVQLQPLV